MAAAPTNLPGPPARGLAEESDIIAALIRTAFIIAFFCTRSLAGVADHTPRYLDFLLGAGAVFNLAIFQAYLRGCNVHWTRPLALLTDLLLITGVISSLGRSSAFLQTSRDLFGLYYLVVITAAIWFRRSGALLSAVAAIALAALTPWLMNGHVPGRELIFGSAKAPLLLLVAFVAGYLVRARDAEHQAAVELSQEMRLARTLQSRMLPETVPDICGFDLGVRFQPARIVGGDFYALRPLDKNRLLVVLADMSGKSVYGLVHLSLVHSHLQTAAEEGLSPAGIAAAVNRGAYAALQPEGYAAVFIGLLDLEHATLKFVNCGHVPPLKLAPAGSRPPELLTTGSIVIGAVPHPEFVEREAVLAPGEMVVCFSDGITEARNRQGEEFGEDRVAAVAAGHPMGTAQEIADEVFSRSRAYAAVGGQDDVTVLVIRREAAVGEPPLPIDP